VKESLARAACASPGASAVVITRRFRAGAAPPAAMRGQTPRKCEIRAHVQQTPQCECEHQQKSSITARRIQLALKTATISPQKANVMRPTETGTRSAWFHLISSPSDNHQTTRRKQQSRDHFLNDFQLKRREFAVRSRGRFADLTAVSAKAISQAHDDGGGRRKSRSLRFISG